MDASSYIQMYSFDLRKRFFKSGSKNFSHLGKEGQIDFEYLINTKEDPYDTFLEFFKTYLSDVKDYDFETVSGQSLSKKKKKIRYNTIDVDKDPKKRIITGFIESGNYGFVSKVIDTNAKVTKTVKEDETNQLRFFFMIHFPKKGKEGVLLLQSIGSRSVRTQIERSLTVYLAKSQLKKKYTFHISTISVAVKKKPNVRQIKLLEKKPQSITKRVSSGKATKTVKARLQSILIFDNGVFPWDEFNKSKNKKNYLDTKIFKNYVKFENLDNNFDYDYKISLEMGKVNRTITVNNSLQYNFGIELEIKASDKDNNGYPKHDKMKAKFLHEFTDLIKWYLK